MEKEAKVFLSCARNLDFGVSKVDVVEPIHQPLVATSPYWSHEKGVVNLESVERLPIALAMVDGVVDTTNKEVAPPSL